jgi:hypothetical protein
LNTAALGGIIGCISPVTHHLPPPRRTTLPAHAQIQLVGAPVVAPIRIVSPHESSYDVGRTLGEALERGRRCSRMRGRAEWAALGEGRDLRTYLPLTHLEEWIPVLFAVVYVGGYVAAVVT